MAGKQKIPLPPNHQFLLKINKENMHVLKYETFLRLESDLGLHFKSMEGSDSQVELK